MQIMLAKLRFGWARLFRRGGDDFGDLLLADLGLER
jgi:hypothetical protein